MTDSTALDVETETAPEGETAEPSKHIGTATYSPEDNKLRLYPLHRLDSETYARVKAAGFKWAPRQGLFVAPAWSPGREDLLTELCGEVGDEDTSLVDRAEQRADRFEDYSGKRAADAKAARDAVARIADNIPFGQPILVGHHSEKHARKDKERIESGMRKAVKMWRTSEYWTDRAAGAIHHAKYKELPAVRARRIKGLEADLRKAEKNKAGTEQRIRLWTDAPDDSATTLKRSDGQPVTFLDRARWIANRDNVTVSREGAVGFGGWSAWDVLRPDEERHKACPAMTPEQVRGICLKAHTEYLAVNARWIEHYQNRLAYERAMLQESGGTAADQTKPEKGGACKCWTSHRGAWSYIVKVNKVSVTVWDNWHNSNDRDGSRNFRRNIELDKLTEVMSAKAVEDLRATGRLVELSDKTGFTVTGEPVPTHRAPEPEAPEAADFEAMAQSLKAGVQVVSAPQLFPTPADVAERMAEYADLAPGMRILEPSAGTGNLLQAIGAGCHVFAVEVNASLADGLRARFPAAEVLCGDFLTQTVPGVPFDRVLMNPPFERGSDIKHILHARRFLKPGGKLVAICANGPRQVEALQPLATHWEDLPEGTFKSQGTNVRTALLVIDGPAA